jgi:hypothetical protein
MIDQHLFAVQLQLLDEFIHHLTYRRGLEEARREAVLPAFWQYTSNAHLLYAVAAWCMVFGSSGQNATHWRNVVQGDEDLLASFRGRLQTELGLDREAWENYHRIVLTFRDNYVAHRHANPPVVPHLDTARDVVFVYDQWVRENSGSIVLDYPLLRDDARQLEQTVHPYLARVIHEVRDLVS